MHGMNRLRFPSPIFWAPENYESFGLGISATGNAAWTGGPLQFRDRWNPPTEHNRMDNRIPMWDYIVNNGDNCL